MTFDARSARLLQPGEHMVIDGAPGLRLQASTAGMAWTYRYKSPDGRMRQIKLGMWPALSYPQALAAWDVHRTARAAGADPAVDRRRQRQAELTRASAERAEQRDGVLTVRRLADEWIHRHVIGRRQPKGLAELRRLLATMLGDVGEMRPQDVTRAVAYALIESHASRPVVAKSLRRELGACWDWAHDSGRLAEDVPNWWRQVMRGRLVSAGKIIKGKHQGAQVKRVLTVDEVGMVLRHLHHMSRLVSDLLTLYLWTGCRGAEICAMRGEELRCEGGQWWWVIPRDRIKMRRHPMAADLWVPMLGRAVEIVSARRDLHGSSWLFPAARKSGGPVQQKTVGAAVWMHGPTCELRPEYERPRWPIGSWSPHDLRRTVRTRLSAIGCPDAVAESVLGHISSDPYARHDYRAERLHWMGLLVSEWERAAGFPATAASSAAPAASR